jgi:hypothetical protein
VGLDWWVVGGWVGWVGWVGLVGEFVNLVGGLNLVEFEFELLGGG